MISVRLFLDDIRQPKDIYPKEAHEWAIVRSYDEFRNFIIANGLPEFISFDHDLSFEHYGADATTAEKTGYSCAQWLTEYCMHHEKPLPDWAVHSMNPAGKANIIGLLKNFESARERWKEHVNVSK